MERLEVILGRAYRLGMSVGRHYDNDFAKAERLAREFADVEMPKLLSEVTRG